MDTNVDNLQRLFSCKICNKTLSSYKSLWRHNKTFHNPIIPPVTNSVTKNVTNSVTNSVTNVTNVDACRNKYVCKTCGKNFNCRQNKFQHQKHCKKDLIVEDNKIIVDPNQQINNQLINNQQNINNGTINNTNNTTNNNTQTIVINQIGAESLDGFSLNDILSIVKEGNNMPITCVKKVNFNTKYPENHSFCATTLEGKHFTRINHKTQKPEKINKIDFINEVLNSSLRFINNIYHMVEFDESFRDNIPKEHQKKLKEILDNQHKFYDPKNKKAFFNCINDMSYNLKDIILKTWELIQPKENENTETDSEEFLMDENYKYLSSDEEN